MDNKFRELATKYFSNETSSEEVHLLVDFLQSSDLYQKWFDELAHQWSLTGKLSHSNFNTVKTKAKIAEAIAISQKKNTVKKLIFRVAAMLILVLGIGGSINFFAFPSDHWVEYSTKSNQNMKVVLPDNSIVWLNSSSTFSYSFSDKSVRKIRLDGEAFFDVKRNTTRPFTIQTNHLFTQVLGTSFNIDSKEEQVSVISGKVAVTNKSNHTVLVEKGEQVNHNKTSEKLSKIIIPNIINTIAWKDQVFVFDDITIKEALKHLGKTYSVNFTYSNNNIEKCKIRASFNNKSLKNILNIMCTSIGCTYIINKENKEIKIFGKGC